MDSKKSHPKSLSLAARAQERAALRSAQRAIHGHLETARILAAEGVRSCATPFVRPLGRNSGRIVEDDAYELSDQIRVLSKKRLPFCMRMLMKFSRAVDLDVRAAIPWLAGVDRADTTTGDLLEFLPELGDRLDDANRDDVDLTEDVAAIVECVGGTLDPIHRLFERTLFGLKRLKWREVKVHEERHDMHPEVPERGWQSEQDVVDAESAQPSWIYVLYVDDRYTCVLWNGVRAASLGISGSLRDDQRRISSDDSAEAELASHERKDCDGVQSNSNADCPDRGPSQDSEPPAAEPDVGSNRRSGHGRTATTSGGLEEESVSIPPTRELPPCVEDLDPDLRYLPEGSWLLLGKVFDEGDWIHVESLVSRIGRSRRWIEQKRSNFRRLRGGDLIESTRRGYRLTDRGKRVVPLWRRLNVTRRPSA